MHSFKLLATLLLGLSTSVSMAEEKAAPTPIIFDTDLGNDCDDVLAFGMIHAMQSRGECELLAVTITKDHPSAAAFADVVNTFYGRGDIPIGVCRSGVTPEEGRYNVLANIKDNGKIRYEHDLQSGKDAPDAVQVLREQLAASEDGSVVIAQVGFSTNLANLLKSEGDDDCPLTGVELVKQKVKVLSIMAGAFTKIPNKKGGLYDHREYNVVKDLPSAKYLCDHWPVSIIWSGYEIGIALPYPHQSILNDYNYVEHHPLSEAYIVYNPPPHNRPTWDLTAVLQGIRPDQNYFKLSPKGQVSIDENGLTTFKESENGRDQYFILDPAAADRITEALVLLSSQPQ